MTIGHSPKGKGKPKVDLACFVYACLHEPVYKIDSSTGVEGQQCVNLIYVAPVSIVIACYLMSGLIAW